MDIDKLYQMWEQDGYIDTTNISANTSDIPKLHNKYFKLYVEQGLKLKKYKGDYKQLYKLKYQYYSGTLSDEELQEYCWKPQQLKILKSDIPTYIEADQDIIRLSLKIGYQQSIVEYLESIIRQINNRGYQMKTILDFERFRQGHG